MSRFLVNKDYTRQIKTDNLLQIVEDDYQLLIDMEMSSQSEIESYIRRRYEVDEIFTNTGTFSVSATYSVGDRVEYSETAFDLQTTYAPDARISFEDKIYKNIATQSIIGINPTYTSDWQYITDNETLYYSIGTMSGFYPNDTTYWIRGDNRNQLILMYMIDMTLYHLHSRINPRNVPDIRVVRYDGNGPNQTGGAIGWLKKVMSGEISPDLPEPTDNEDNLSIVWGSDTKNNQIY